MESEIPSPVAVKGSLLTNESGSAEKEDRKNSGDEDCRTFNFYLRAEGLLNGVFITKGKGRTRYYDLTYEYFHRKTGTKGGKQISLRTIERNMPKFWRWSDCYRAEKTRVGRRWVMRVTPRTGVQLAIPGAMIRDRLIAAILSHVAKAGRTHVNQEFIRKFSELSALPLTALEAVLFRDRKFVSELRGVIEARNPGAAITCKFRGVGCNRKLLVTDAARWAAVQAENAAKLAALYTGENLQGGSSFGTDKLHARSAFLRNERLKNSGLPPAGPEDRARATPAEVEAGYHPPDHDPPDGCDGPNPPPGVREPSAGVPLQICGRFIRPAKLGKCARWLAGSRLEAVHLTRERIAFVFTYAANFALKALRFGYGVDAIVRGYAAGVQRSHEDALDVDRLPGGGYSGQRFPSAAVVYAWQAMRAADPRTPDELWAAFFSAPRRPRDSVSEKRARAAAVAKVRKSTAAADSPRVAAQSAIAEKLRAKIGAMQAAQRAANADLPVTAGDVIAYLAHIGMRLAEFQAVPYAQRQAFFRRAAAWKKGGGGGAEKNSVVNDDV